MMRKIMNRHGLARPPFTKEVPVEDLFEHAGAARVIRRLKSALEGKSSAVLTGDTGSGKTFVLRALDATLPAGRYRITYIHNATVNRRDFYRQLSSALGLEPKAVPSALFRMLSSHIEELASAQNLRPVLFLDEAHLLPVAVLEHLHILLNFHMDSAPFLSLILVGLPELRDRLRRNVLASLGARLPVRVELRPLDAGEVGGYLKHRMNQAGAGQDVFSEDATLLIAEATGGILRKIDVLAQASLEIAANGRGSLVDASVIEKAIETCAEALL